MTPLFDTSTLLTFGLASAALVAAYLVFLGVRAWRAARGAAVQGAMPAASTPTGHLLAHATVTGILNPKVAVFFLAFLPQFVDPARGRAFLQFILLGLGFALLGLLGDSFVALVASRARHRILAASRWAQWRERLTGTLLIALGIRLAFQSRN